MPAVIQSNRGRHRLRVLAAFMATVLAAAVVPGAASASREPGSTPRPSASVVAAAPAPAVDAPLAARLATAVNRTRAAQGLTELTVDAERVGSAAAYRTLDIAQTRTVAPTTSDGYAIGDLLLGAGVRFAWAGEMVAVATSGPSGVDPLPRLLVQLLADPVDRRLMLEPGADMVGVAVARRPASAGADLTSDGAAGEGMLVASVILVRRDGPAAPGLAVSADRQGGAIVAMTPDGSGRATVVVTDRVGTLLRILAWDQRVRGRVSWHWDGRLTDGTPAPSDIYQIRAFTVNADGRASDPAVTLVTTHR